MYEGSFNQLLIMKQQWLFLAWFSWAYFDILRSILRLCRYFFGPKKLSCRCYSICSSQNVRRSHLRISSRSLLGGYDLFGNDVIRLVRPSRPVPFVPSVPSVRRRRDARTGLFVSWSDSSGIPPVDAHLTLLIASLSCSASSPKRESFRWKEKKRKEQDEPPRRKRSHDMQTRIFVVFRRAVRCASHARSGQPNA